MKSPWRRGIDKKIDKYGRCAAITLKGKRCQLPVAWAPRYANSRLCSAHEHHRLMKERVS